MGLVRFSKQHNDFSDLMGVCLFSQWFEFWPVLNHFVAVRTFKVGRDSVGAEVLLQIIIICHFADLVVHHALFNPVINELLKST